MDDQRRLSTGHDEHLELTGVSSLPDTQYNTQPKGQKRSKKKKKKDWSNDPFQVKVNKNPLDKVPNDLIIQGVMLDIKPEDKDK